MSKKLTLLVICLYVCALQAQTSISGIINHYTAVSDIDYCESILTVSNAADFQVGQQVWLIQMQGALIDESNSSSFGNLTNLNSAGLHERSSIVNIIGNQIYLEYLLVNAYDSFGSLQLVTVPVYADAIVMDTLQPQAWNGTTGGVLALEVDGTLTMNAPVNASGKGFRGGIAETISPNNCSWLLAENDYYYDLNTWRGAAKGEGIAAFISDKEAGKGAQANGGGGANDHNSGGGGGAHLSNGGPGGENDEPTTFGCDGFHPGQGGKGIADNQYRFYMGGGGGAGHMNNEAGTNGGNGGGIIFIKTNTLVGNAAIIDVSGATSPNTAGADGGGGGGAAGSLILDAMEVSTSLTLNASGGNGSSVNNTNFARCMGPGGGGAGGVITTSIGDTSSFNILWDGGAAGVTFNSTEPCNNSSMNALGGVIGQVTFWLEPVVGFEEVLATNITQQPFVNLLCEGDSPSITIDVEGNGLEYQWQINEGGGFVDMEEGVLYSGTTSSILTLTDLSTTQDGFIIRCLLASNCFAEVISDEVTLNVLGPPTASFDYTVSGTEVTFNNTSQNMISTESWGFGDGNFSSDANPVHDYMMIGTYQVTLIVENDCFSDTMIQEVVLGVLPSADFSVYDMSGCAPYEVFYTDNSSGNVQTWAWSFPGGNPEMSSAQNPTVVYDTPGQYSASLAVTNAVGSNSITYADFINVLAVPVADFSVGVNDFTVDFSNLSAHAHIYSWEFGDGNVSSDESPMHTYTQNGIYPVILSAANDYCEDVVVIEVEVMVSGMDGAELEGLEIYPVPFDKLLVMNFGKSVSDLEVELFDAKGSLLIRKKMGSGSLFALDVAGLGAGVYLVRGVVGEGVFVWRVVKG